MNEEIKTLDKWKEYVSYTNKNSIYQYLRVGDVVSEDIVEYFLGSLPSKDKSFVYRQVTKIYDYAYDSHRKLRPIFMTFVKCNGCWRYYGNCFAYESIDRSWN